MQSTANDDLAAGSWKTTQTLILYLKEVHAETLMMEHFYFNQLHFFGNDRYIGCSKPSCYYCDLWEPPRQFRGSTVSWKRVGQMVPPFRGR